ncbi:hypothetical protein H5P28_01155 [Ruficoccus amylovorans]|uniref:Uncharacterized protein n=1 Tax=Ruficoccus amylovorans TaxID=1804625 RepID=A0A842HB49_9BACT|nr:hypothetical protein [Ruficoccus amylovorans]MBC2592857.1 hypothetical protein [Ruficoccus amylovorans]
METTTETTSDKSTVLRIPAEIMATFQRSNDFLTRRYQNAVPSPEELIIFYLSGIEAHEVVAGLERQVLLLSGKQPPEQDDHLVQTYLDMEAE